MNNKDAALVLKLSMKLDNLTRAKEALQERTISQITISFVNCNATVNLVKDDVVTLESTELQILDEIDERILALKHMITRILAS